MGLDIKHPALSEWLQILKNNPNNLDITGTLPIFLLDKQTKKRKYNPIGILFAIYCKKYPDRYAIELVSDDKRTVNYGMYRLIDKSGPRTHITNLPSSIYSDLGIRNEEICIYVTRLSDVNRHKFINKIEEISHNRAKLREISQMITNGRVDSGKESSSEDDALKQIRLAIANFSSFRLSSLYPLMRHGINHQWIYVLIKTAGDDALEYYRWHSENEKSRIENENRLLIMKAEEYLR